MNTIQREQLNRFLAETVLGGIERDGVILINHGGVWFSPDFFTLADCEPLLDKIEQDGWQWIWSNEPGGSYELELTKEGELCRVGYGESRTASLCLAIARCYGWKEEG